MSGMPDKPPPRTTEHADAGDRIRARRSYLNKSRPDIERETNGLLYTDLQKRVENGDKKVRTIYAGHLKAYMAALDWTPADLERETGISILEEEETPGSEPWTGGIAVGYYGTVSAGLGAVEGMNTPEQMVNLDPILPGISGRASRRLGLLRVNGDSMVSPKAAESIPKGSMVLVEWGAAPIADDVVVAWLADYETAVLKEFKESSDVVLRSYNPHGPVFRASDDIDIRGVVRLIFRKP